MSPQQQSQTQPTPPENQTQPSQLDSEGDEPIELVVTGEQDGYNVPDAATATKTDTPLRDIPQSIQVIPRQLLEDRQITRVQQIADNVAGVQEDVPGGGAPGANFIIRGFGSPTNY